MLLNLQNKAWYPGQTSVFLWSQSYQDWFTSTVKSALKHKRVGKPEEANNTPPLPKWTQPFWSRVCDRDLWSLPQPLSDFCWNCKSPNNLERINTFMKSSLYKPINTSIIYLKILKTDFVYFQTVSTSTTYNSSILNMKLDSLLIQNQWSQTGSQTVGACFQMFRRNCII